MTVVQRSAIVTCSAETLFDLVNDIPKYPEFLPWCLGARIDSLTENGVLAELTVGKAGITQSFKTRTVLSKPERIEIHLVEGMFKQLSGVWQFQALSADACKVSFNLQFEFSNKITALAMSAIFHQAADTLVDAFCARAQQLQQAKNGNTK
jgi:ribosome-associated toxin RatA of RatAB toxin-antitoxin module